MKNILIAILFITSSLSFSQTYQFKTSSFSVSQKNTKGKWSEWTLPVNSEMVINLDRDKHRFVVYSEILQLFEILKYEEKVETDKETTNKYYCKDGNGLEVLVTIIMPKDATLSKQMYISYADMIILYNVIYLGEK
jgi:hypothetical protein